MIQEIAGFKRKACQCDLCGHEWLTLGFPEQCARCRSRYWNGGEESREQIAARRHIKKEARKVDGDQDGAKPPRVPVIDRTPTPSAVTSAPIASAGEARNADRKGYDHTKYLSLSPSDQLRYLREHPRR